MKTRYIRRPPKREDDLAAAAVSVALAAGVGAVTFYVVRMLLSRDVVSPPAEREKLDAPPR